MSFNYTVEKPSGATYGFSPKADNYYESTNKGVNSSYAMAKLNFTTDGSYKLYLDCINYAETNYDFGILSELDKTLQMSNTADSTNVKRSFKGSSSTNVQTVDYGQIANGSHYIYIKFRKDSSVNKNYDSLKFKVRTEQIMPVLGSPTISLNGDILTITPVANATSYKVFSNNNLLTTSTTTTVDLSTLFSESGTYTITVTALASGYLESGPSNAVTYKFQLITLDLTTLNLSQGTHTIKVKAKAEGYGDSAFSNEVSYTVLPPQLYPPIFIGISVDGICEFSDNQKNGSFTEYLILYVDNTPAANIQLNSNGIGTFDLSTLGLDDGMTVLIAASAHGNNFRDSELSNTISYTQVGGNRFEVQVSVRSDTDSSLNFYDGQGTSGTSLGSVSPGSSATFSVSSGYLYVSFGFSADSYYDPGTTTGGVSFQDRNYDHFLYRVAGNGTISNMYAAPCFVEGTLITLADGTQKKVEDINYGDEVLCYDFNEGKQTTAPIEFVMKKMQSNFYYKVSLSDGTELKLVGSNGKSHRLYNVTKQSFMYPQDFEENDYTLKQDGTIATISSIEKVEEKVNFYNISSKDHINVYAENVLTSNRLNNRFEIKNNKFTDKKLMTDEEIKAYKEHMERLKK